MLLCIRLYYILFAVSVDCDVTLSFGVGIDFSEVTVNPHIPKQTPEED